MNNAGTPSLIRAVVVIPFPLPRLLIPLSRRPPPRQLLLLRGPPLALGRITVWRIGPRKRPCAPISMMERTVDCAGIFWGAGRTLVCIARAEGNIFLFFLVFGPK